MSRLRGQLVDPLLSVVMPAYNERNTIEEIIRRVLAVPIRTELIVVDDGSRDGTRDILARLAQELAFKLILQPVNSGKGAALRRGFQEVTGDLVVIQDADLEYSPEEFPELIALICAGRADVESGGTRGAQLRLDVDGCGRKKAIRCRSAQNDDVDLAGMNARLLHCDPRRIGSQRARRLAVASQSTLDDSAALEDPFMRRLDAD